MKEMNIQFHKTRPQNPFDDGAKARLHRMGLLRIDGSVDEATLNALSRAYSGLLFDDLCDTCQNSCEITEILRRVYEAAEQAEPRQKFLSNQQKYILEILKEFKYLRVRQLHAMVRTHYRAQGIEIDARRMEIMLRQMRTGTNYVWLRGDVVSYGDRRIDPRLLEALDVMLELTKAQPGFYSKDGLHEPFLLRFTGNGKGAGYLFSVAWLDAATHIATVPRMKGERIIWISESNSFGEINLPRHHFFAVRQEDGTHRFFGSNEPGKI